MKNFFFFFSPLFSSFGTNVVQGRRLCWRFWPVSIWSEGEMLCRCWTARLFTTLIWFVAAIWPIWVDLGAKLSALLWVPFCTICSFFKIFLSFFCLKVNMILPMSSSFELAKWIIVLKRYYFCTQSGRDSTPGRLLRWTYDFWRWVISCNTVFVCFCLWFSQFDVFWENPAVFLSRNNVYTHIFVFQ